MIPIWLIMLIIVVGIFLIIWLIMSIPLVGFWNRYVLARIAGGGVILVKFRSKTGDYWKRGRLLKKRLIVKKRNSKEKTEFTIPDTDSEGKPVHVFYRMMGVWCVDIDEETNSFCTIAYRQVQGFDEETYEYLVVRAMMDPKIAFLKKYLVYIMVGIGILILGFIIAIVMIKGLKTELKLEHAETLKMLADYFSGKVIS